MVNPGFRRRFVGSSLGQVPIIHGFDRKIARGQPDLQKLSVIPRLLGANRVIDSLDMGEEGAWYTPLAIIRLRLRHS